MLEDDWPLVRNIHWLNQQRNEEVSLAYMAVSTYESRHEMEHLRLQYGNQIELDHYYSSAAILFYVPPYAQRKTHHDTMEPQPHSQAQPQAGSSMDSIEVD